MTNAVETNRILGSPPNWCVIPPCLPNLLWKLFLPICIESARLDTTMTLAQSEPKNLVYKIAPDAQALFCRRRHQPRRPPHAKIRPGKPPPGDGGGDGILIDDQGNPGNRGKANGGNLSNGSSQSARK